MSRPEHLSLEPGAADFAGAVSFVEPTGAQTQVAFTAGGHAMNAIVGGNRRFGVGEAVHFSAPLDHIHVFDTESGARLSTKAVETVK